MTTTVWRGAATGRMAQLLNGDISVEDLDDEELARGQCRDSQGNFSGRPNRVVPRDMQQEMIRRLLDRGNELWRSAFNIAIRTHIEIAGDPNVPPGVRLQASQYIIERVSGKTPERIQVEATDPVVQIFRALLNRDDGLEDVVDGEVEEQGQLVPFGQ